MTSAAMIYDHSAYTYVPYSPKYRDEVLELQTVLWSRNPEINVDYLRWKYEDNPYLGDTSISLALHRGKVVGMRGAWAALWHVATDELPQVIPCTGDTAIAPAHRRRGVMRGLNRSLMGILADKNFHLALSLSASKPVYFGCIKDGWKPLVEYRHLTRIPAIFRYRRTRKLRAKYIHAAPVSLRNIAQNSRRLAHVSNSESDFEVLPTPRATAMAELVRGLAPPGLIGPVRDEAFYSRRFDCPLSRYLFIYAGKHSLDGFIVLQLKQHFRRSINIVDWEAANEAVFDRMIAVAIRLAGFDDLKTWSASVPAPFMSRLKAAGFAESQVGATDGYKRSLLARATDAGQASELDSMFPESDTRTRKLRMICSDDY